MENSCKWLVRAKITLLFLACCQPGIGAGADMNPYVIKAMDAMTSSVSGRGYDLRSAFTEDQRYGDACCLKATGGGRTMCVAAVAEVLFRAINLYATERRDPEAYSRLPLQHWAGHKYLNLRPHLFQYAEAKSGGPGDAFSRFGIGKRLQFEELKTGDALSFSRFNGSGHAVIFLSYLESSGKRVNQYSANVIGFTYFSAQTSTNGIGTREAYFGSVKNTKCPGIAKTKSDCGIIREKYINAGRMDEPGLWTVESSLQNLSKEYRVTIAKTKPSATLQDINEAMNADLKEEFSVDFNE